jgi:hypothetical protein
LNNLAKKLFACWSVAKAHLNKYSSNECHPLLISVKTTEYKNAIGYITPAKKILTKNKIKPIIK